MKLPEEIRNYLARQKMRNAISFFLSSLLGALTSACFASGFYLLYHRNLFLEVPFYSFILPLPILFLLLSFFFLPTRRTIRKIAKIDPEAGEVLISSLELAREWEKGEKKEEWLTLVKEFMASAKKIIKEKESHVKVNIFPSLFFYLPALTSLIFLTAALLFYKWRGDKYEFIKNLKIDIIPPPYALIDPFSIFQTYELRDVLKGSSLRISFEVDKKVEKVRIMQNHSDYYADKENNFFSFPMRVTESGEIQILGKIGLKWFENPKAIKIQVKKDEIPEVTLLFPREDLLLKKEKKVMFTFDAKDDFGISSLRLAIDRDGSTEYLEILTGTGEKHIIKTLSYDASGMREGERAFAWIEVFDNDSISGPKIGRSKVISIEIYSPTKVLMQLLDRIDELFQLTLDVLGYQIEYVLEGTKPFSPDSLKNLDLKEDGIFSQFDELFKLAKERMKEHRGKLIKIMNAYRNFKNAVFERRRSRNNTGEMKSKFLKEIEENEKFILLLDKEWRDEILSIAREEIERLLKRKEELLAKLDSSKNPQQILKELEKINKMLMDILSKVGNKLAEIPEDYVNPVDKYRVQAGFEGQSILEEIRKALEEGNIERAKSLLKKYFESMEELSASLKNLSGEIAMGGMEAFKTFSEVMRDIKYIKEQEKSLQKKHVEEISQKDKNREKEIMEVKEKLKEYVEKSRSYYEEAKRNNAFPLRFPFLEEKLMDVEERFSELVRNVEEGDYGDLKENAVIQKEDLEHLKDVTAGRENKNKLQESGEYIEKIIKFLNELSKLRLPDNMRENLKNKQCELKEGLGRVRRKAGELGSENLMEKIKGAEDSMKKAERGIEEKKDVEAIGKEERAIRLLEEAEGEMEKMMEEMQGKRVLGFMPGEEGYEVGGEVERGNVKIPEEEKYEVKEKLRKKLESVLKEGLPEEKRSLNRKYYNELIE